MTIKRIIHRLWYYPLKVIIDLTEPINNNMYMKSKTFLLKSFGMKIEGQPLYIHKTVKFDDFDKISLKNNIVISFGVYFLTHDYSRLVAYNYLTSKFGTDIIQINNIDNPLIKEILIGENTFIGCRSLILPGTVIGMNCIIGAGSVVKGRIPDNSVVIGNPAKIIGNVTDLGTKWLLQHNVIITNGPSNTSN